MSFSKIRYLPFMMWFFPVLFFAFQFILRLWPGLTMHHTMAQYHIDASRFGLLAALYYYGYAGMQIPVALLLDRFKVHYVLCFFVLLCGIATCMFTLTNSFYLALFSRFLIGAGSAAGFLGVSKVVSQWFSQDKYATMIGFSFTIGLMGAIYGGKPVNSLIEVYGWQHVALTLSLAAVLIGLAIILFLREPVEKKMDEIPHVFQFSHFRSILSSPAIWGLACVNFLMVGSLEGFADVWGVPYLVAAYGIQQGEAAGLTSLIFFGMLFGGPLLTWLAKSLGNYTVIALCGMIMVLGFVVLLFTKIYYPYFFAAVFFTIGVMCCYQVIIFSAGSQLVKPGYLGVTLAFLNCVNMLGGSFFHTVIGHVMDRHWTGMTGHDGVRLYDISAYLQALGFIPICAVLGVVIIVMVKWRVNPLSDAHYPEKRQQ